MSNVRGNMFIETNITKGFTMEETTHLGGFRWRSQRRRDPRKIWITFYFFRIFQANIAFT